MKMTKQGYEYYLSTREKIIRNMEANDAILDVADKMVFGEYEDLGSLYSAEYPDMTEKQIARKMAEDQTYFQTPAQTAKFMEAVQNYWDRMGTPTEERDVLRPEDFIYGTKAGRQLHYKYSESIKEFYHSLRETGLSGKEAGQVISQVLYGSE